MSERWVAHVMGIASRLDYGTYFLEERSLQIRVLLSEFSCHIVAQGFAQGGNFKRVGQTVVDKNASGSGKTCVLFCNLLKGAE